MPVEQTFTREQLRAAVVQWEQDIRANPDAFMKGDEARAIPIEEIADQYVGVLFGYMGKEEDAPLVGCNEFALGNLVEDRVRLRDEIAMRVLQGSIAEGGMARKEGFMLDEARNAYAYADVMLKAREGA